MKNTYLNRMGIQTWHLRDTVHASDCFYVTLCDASQQCMGCIVADLDAAVNIDVQKNLLQKIAEALTAHFSIIQTDSVETELRQCHFMILLGDDCKKYACKATCVVESYSLVGLLSDVEHKKALWTEIKSLRQFFQ